MKRSIAILLAVLLLTACAPVFASAADDKLPFELVAPAYVSAHWEEENDSPTTTSLTFSLSNDMTAFFKNMSEASLNGTSEQFMAEVGCDDIWMVAQIDWAVDDVKDSVSGWHYTEYWDGNSHLGFGVDEDGNHRHSDWDGVDVGLDNAEGTVQDFWVTRGVPNDDRWNGNPDTLTPGVKDQLRPDQYEYTIDDEGDGTLRIDMTKHTIYYRVRFALTIRNDGEDDRYYFSEWSNTASVGKDAASFTPLTKEDLTAPVITSLRMTDKEFNDNPVVAFTLTVPEKLSKDASEVTANGGQIVIETWARVKGDPDFVELQGDWIIRAGEMEADLFSLANAERPTVPKDAIVELRCRYRYDHPVYFDGEIYSDWSKVISFGTDDINYHDTSLTSGTGDSEDPQNPSASSCPICHFCPQPLGLCIFIWLLILLVIIVIVVVIIVVVKKSKKKES